MADGTLNFDTKLDASGFTGAVGKLGGIAGAAFAGVTAAVGAGTAAFAGLTKSALDNVASYEQLVGGVETLFGAGGATIEEYAASVGKSVSDVKGEFSNLETAQKTVLDNANKAYQTAGMSANQYMETVTSFAASLKQSTSGEVEAANVADQAIRDMSDNANKMGSSMESVQSAYQGFAKQNYAMLDNLKLGYGGNKTEMERLLADAEKIHQEATGEVTHYDINNLSDVYTAIHEVQTELGITGTTAKEASTTIEGSMNAAKASWDNFLTGTGDVDQLAESVATLANNVVNNLSEIIPRLASGLPTLVSKLGGMIPGLSNQILPPLIDGAVTLINGLISVLPELVQGLLPPLLQGAASVIAALVSVLPPLLMTVASVCLDLMEQLGSQVWAWISTNVGGWIDGIASWFAQLPERIWTWLVNTVTKIIQWGVSMQQNASTAIQNMISSIISFMQQLPGKIWTWLVNTANRLNAWRQDLISKGTAATQGLFNAVVNGIKALPEKMLSIGKDIVTGIWNGISSGWNWLIGKVKDLANSLLQGAKDALGIGSPSKAFRDEFGRWLLPGAEIGIEKTMPGALKTMRESATALLEEMRGTVADYSGEIALSAGSSQGRKAIAVGGTSIYYDNRIDQTNNYHEAVPTPSAVAKNQREAIRNIVGGVK